MTKADPHLISELLGKPLPKPGDNFCSKEQVDALLARARTEGRDVTDAEFFAALGLPARPSPEDRKRACAELAAVREAAETAAQDLAKTLALIAKGAV